MGGLCVPPVFLLPNPMSKYLNPVPFSVCVTASLRGDARLRRLRKRAENSLRHHHLIPKVVK